MSAMEMTGGHMPTDGGGMSGGNVGNWHDGGSWNWGGGSSESNVSQTISYENKEYSADSSTNYDRSSSGGHDGQSSEHYSQDSSVDYSETSYNSSLQASQSNDGGGHGGYETDHSGGLLAGLA